MPQRTRILEPLLPHTRLAGLLTEFGRWFGDKERISSEVHGGNVQEVAVGAIHGKVGSVVGAGCPGAITVILAILYRKLPILERSWEDKCG